MSKSSMRSNEGKGALILLAGGASRRMGTDKALLDFDGEPLARRVIHRLHGRGEWEPFIVANRFHPFTEWGWPVVRDPWPGAGPLAGLVAGLQASSHDWNLAVACDMPFVSRELAAVMYQSAVVESGSDAVIPRTGGKFHPLFACYHRRCLPVGEALLKNGERSLQALRSMISIHVLDEADFPPSIDPERALFNMNRPSDLKRARKWK
ncbi:molybdenum cofactor guanylyltransferase [Desmospora profundinema]|uniref:Probable molybdenum cofactor guanylyltransferase n=1 Tax=Desmospora profundinema TaxID=1571184 RepID=A0ABU1INY8_9BACL|nr:molybdenum cofactor guanylyltransferase [Desmospora profundinema]MDR6226501.1 molybdopterin-guanine dinucleotide biosynthesis protein A [Desmospora profundinema]